MAQALHGNLLSVSVTYLVLDATMKGGMRHNVEWTDRIKSESQVSSDEDFVGRSAQKLFGQLIPKIRQRQKMEDRASLSKGHSSSAATSPGYELEYLDLEHNRGHFLLGASVGTPSLLNIDAGYWGGHRLPLIAEVSGMYFSSATRGAQIDLGWCFDDNGNRKQGIAISGALLNQSQSQDSTSYDVLGRPLSVTTLSTNTLEPYIGPSYLARWKSFSALIGITTAMGSDAISRFRVLVQVGFVPELSF